MVFKIWNVGKITKITKSSYTVILNPKFLNIFFLNA